MDAATGFAMMSALYRQQSHLSIGWSSVMRLTMVLR